jgi:hypothetical protein
MTTTTQRTYKSEVHAARAWAKRNGYEGRGGGWVYRVGAQRPVCQGWGGFAQRLIDRHLIAPADPTRPWGTYVIAIKEG